MLAATYTQGNGFSVEDIPEPAIERSELLVRIRAASICGTDVKIVNNGHRKLRVGQRIVLGHELVGEIVDAGRDVVGFAAGQRIGIVPNTGCGRCRACLRGKANYCTQYEAFGITRDGSHAPLLRVPAVYLEQGNVVAMPEGISDAHASLLEPLSCVVNGTRAAGIERGDRVVIYGAGTMGLLFVQLARVQGASQVIVVGRREHRLSAARALGADVTIDNKSKAAIESILDATGGEGADVVITACASTEPQLEATEVLAPFGRLCLFGSLPRGSGLPTFDTNAVHYKNLQVTGTTGGSIDDYRAALQLVASGQIDLDTITARVYSLDDLEDAYASALSGTLTGKVVLTANSN